MKDKSKVPAGYADVHTSIIELVETTRHAAARSINALMTAVIGRLVSVS